MFGSISLTVVF